MKENKIPKALQRIYAQSQGLKKRIIETLLLHQSEAERSTYLHQVQSRLKAVMNHMEWPEWPITEWALQWQEEVEEYAIQAEQDQLLCRCTFMGGDAWLALDATKRKVRLLEWALTAIFRELLFELEAQCN